ncbi:MAG: TolC family protein [Magnetococcales bacterium]|nr:TolC family protein [Magnetococcales bacterium]
MFCVSGKGWLGLLSSVDCWLVQMSVAKTSLPLVVRLLIGSALLMVSAGCVVKPQALTEAEQMQLVQADQTKMFQNQDPIPDTLTIYDAMARAIKYNLDHRLKLMEGLLSSNQLDLTRAELLPNLVTSAGYSSRSNAAASSSQSVQNGTLSLESSTSQNRDQEQIDLSLTWNVLDFGVSYFRARQEADRLLITEERRRKVIQNLIREIRYAFWRAWGAQSLAQEIGVTLKEADAGLSALQRIEDERLRPPLEILRYRRSILEAVVQLEKLRDDLAMAHVELAPLMNMPPGVSYKLAAEEPVLTVFPTDLPLEALERLALRNRPELREENYQARISVEETRKTLARLFPGLEMSLTGNHDSNTFLVNQSWAEAGLHISWNLINLATAPRRLEWAKAQESVTDTRRLALHMAILSQIHIAWRQYLTALQQYRRAMDLSTIDREILRHVTTQQDQAAEGRLEQVRNRVKVVLTRLQQHQALAQLENALGQLQVAVGADPIPPNVKEGDLGALSREIEKNLAEWDQALVQGQIPARPDMPGKVPVAPQGSDTAPGMGDHAVVGADAPDRPGDGADTPVQPVAATDTSGQTGFPGAMQGVSDMHSKPVDAWPLTGSSSVTASRMLPGSPARPAKVQPQAAGFWRAVTIERVRQLLKKGGDRPPAGTSTREMPRLVPEREGRAPFLSEVRFVMLSGVQRPPPD